MQTDIILNRLELFIEVPTFQLERRIDPFIQYYLCDVLEEKFKSKFDFLIPEFPIPHTLLRAVKNYRAEYIDYVCCTKIDNRIKIFFIELKTDDGSIRPNQIRSYNAMISNNQNWNIALKYLYNRAKVRKGKWRKYLNALNCVYNNNNSVLNFNNKFIKKLKVNLQGKGRCKDNLFESDPEELFNRDVDLDYIFLIKRSNSKASKAIPKEKVFFLDEYLNIAIKLHPSDEDLKIIKRLMLQTI